MPVRAPLLAALPLLIVGAARAGEPAPDDKRWLVRPLFGVNLLELDLSHDDAPDLNYTPNSRLMVGARLGYRRFQFSFTFNVPGTEEDTGKYGRSEYFDLQGATTFRAAGHEWLLSGFFQSYRGFFLENTEQLSPGAAPILYPNLNMAAAGGSLTYFTNPQFSYDATFLDYRHRPGGAGSWAFRGTLGLMGFDNEGASIIPMAAQTGYSQVAGLNAAGSVYLSAGVGYTRDWLFGEHGFLAGSVLAGPTFALQSYELNQVRTNNASLAPNAVVTLATGYIADTFHGGLYINAEGDSTAIHGATALMWRIFVAAFIGARF
jgi:hypothetical protein